MGETKHNTRLAHAFDQIDGVFHRSRHGFIANDMQALRQRGYALWVMEEVRSHDGHCINGVVTRWFFFQHFFERSVGPVFCDADLDALFM